SCLCVSPCLIVPIRPPPLSTIFPYTTLFRSATCEQAEEDRGDSGRELDQVGCRGLLGRGASPGLPAVEEAHRCREERREVLAAQDRKSTRLNSSHQMISYAVFCLKIKTADHV